MSGGNFRVGAVALAVGLLGAVLAPAAGAAGDAVSAQAIVTTSFTFTDSTRGASCAGVSTPGREIPTTVVYDGSRTGLPVLVLAHGFGGFDPGLVTRAQDYASRGYFVVVPRFPVTGKVPPFVSTPDVCTFDIPHQPGDVSFVLSALTNMLGSGLPAGLFDPNHTGIKGNSGGAITGLLFFNTCCADARFKAVLAEKGYPALSPLGPSTPYDFSRHIALFMLNGCFDTRLDQGARLSLDENGFPRKAFPEAFAMWSAVGAPKYFIEDPDPAFVHNVPFKLPAAAAAAPDAFLDRYVKGIKTSATLDALLANAASPDYRFVTEVSGAASNSAPSPCATPPPTRISGEDAIGTSLAISQAAFPGKSPASAVVVARSDFFADALAGGPLAAKVDGPLLITPGATLSTGLDSRVLTEIHRVLPAGKTVYILGGQLALDPSIDGVLTQGGYVVVRLAGANAFATAVAIANQLGNPSSVFEATGLNFPDALSAVPAAIKTHGAILLTNGSTQAPETQAYLAAHASVTRYAIGGPLAAAGADPGASAVFGADAFGTSAAVASTFFAHTTSFGIATGTNFPDALSGSVFMATGGRMGPMLLVSPTLPLPASIAAYLAGQALGTPSYVFGGPLAIGANVLAAIQHAVG